MLPRRLICLAALLLTVLPSCRCSCCDSTPTRPALLLLLQIPLLRRQLLLLSITTTTMTTTSASMLFRVHACETLSGTQKSNQQPSQYTEIRTDTRSRGPDTGTSHRTKKQHNEAQKDPKRKGNAYRTSARELATRTPIRWTLKTLNPLEYKAIQTKNSRS